MRGSGKAGLRGERTVPTSGRMTGSCTRGDTSAFQAWHLCSLANFMTSLTNRPCKSPRQAAWPHLSLVSFRGTGRQRLIADLHEHLL